MNKCVIAFDRAGTRDLLMKTLLVAYSFHITKPRSHIRNN